MCDILVLLRIRIGHQLIYNSPKSTAIWGHRSPIHPVIAIPIALWSWHEPTKPLSPAAGRSPLHLRNSLRINIHFCICDLMTRTGTIIIGFSVYISHCCFCDSWTLDSGCTKCYVVWCVFRDFLAPTSRQRLHQTATPFLSLVLPWCCCHHDIAALQCSWSILWCMTFFSLSWLMRVTRAVSSLNSLIPGLTLKIRESHESVVPVNSWCMIFNKTAYRGCQWNSKCNMVTCHHNGTVVTRPAIHCLSIRRKTKSLEKRLAKAWLRWSCKQFDTTCGSKSKDTSPKR